jgi:hypothetical protein
MSEEESILVSVILNMALDGKCDLSKLSPHVAEFIEGTVLEYKLDEEYNELLYWYAHETLKLTSTRTLH